MKKVVTIGGGTGSFMLLSGLKNYPIELSAIVSMADDGGSTGVLRDELGVLPPGDVRQCLVALSESEDMLRDLMNYRFSEGGLAGHNFGNIFLSALEKITGSFSEGVVEAAQILNVKGAVFPVTNVDTNLKVELKNGKVLSGEHELNTDPRIRKVGIKKAFLEPKAKANPQAVERILSADLIVIGPGNHYCSILPNLLVKGIPEAICKSKAKVVYNCNLINKRGHTDNFTLDDYVREINGFLGAPRVDFVTFNTGKPAKKLIDYYSVKDGELVAFSPEENPTRNYRVLRAKLLNRRAVKFDEADKISAVRSFIRHDSERLAKILIMLLELEGYENIIRDIV